MSTAQGKSGPGPGTDPTQELKSRIRDRLLQQFNLSALESLASEEAREQVHATLQELVQTDAPDLTGSEREALIQELLDEILGLGPLEPLLAGPRRLGHPGQQPAPSTSSAGRLG